MQAPPLTSFGRDDRGWGGRFGRDDKWFSGCRKDATGGREWAKISPTQANGRLDWGTSGFE